ncbi:MAG: tRNA 2-thiouridine(34) synthase MnmA [Candidatus Parcubacteria bacterium]
MKSISKKPKVFVGMSGGVDSSVSALLLKLAGYDVTGVFIKVWQPENGECTWKDERRDAMRVAAALDITFLTFDFAERYKKDVVDYMINEYKLGRTPNPDVMCNRQIKFGSFLDEALKQGADFIATGHYAQNIVTLEASEMHEGKDPNKDQSYFLWTLNQKDLKHTLFPIGHLLKPEVRKLAEKYKLPVFDKKDSQGICFLGHVDMKEFLKEYIQTEKGAVLDAHGAIIGEHDGSLLYTIGERHGFRLTITRPDDTPHYIVAKDLEKNIITVVPQDIFKKGDYMPKTVELTSVNWTITEPDLTKSYEARSRYRQQKQTCRISKGNSGQYSVSFDQPQTALTPGQSIVIYSGSKCIGGGILS